MSVPTHFLHDCQMRIQPWLEQFLAAQNGLAKPLSAAMRYAVLNGGKRIRPALAYAACVACGGHINDANSAAGAVELVHCYSLVHDDLPCMDDDDLRRGVPTCHKAFDEATALLAGDTLQALAFVALACSHLDDTIKTRQVQQLALASANMAVGQALDLAGEGKQLSLHELEAIHRHKTGALIRASVLMGASAAGCTDEQTLASLENFADKLGLAFQVHDDVLDVIGDTQKLGKHAGADAEHAKATYPALLGLQTAQQLAVQLHDDAISAIKHLGCRANALIWLADFLVARDH
ncbi:polyprenyl synthetase family protein [Agitococcus lubricus]|uniref:Farnesyl-diphosphate synthase n=1 Tax=Agitococcus lubricus TaxID=1077255 RepID=A0A2T5J3K8_9GAMM|nr:farnesyl diphosphate synthase [Agitococcus lubricus]PTQ91195.1 farnesyl-diphosphate synthase [Agitococcus lubricus]